MILITFYASILLTIFAEECTRDVDVIRQLFVGDNGTIKPEGKDGLLLVNVGIEVTSMTIVPHSNAINVGFTLTRTWNDPSLYFNHLQPCHPYVSLVSHRSHMWIPEFSFPNYDGQIHKHSTHIELSSDGTIVHSTRLRHSIPCKTSALDYPFGNTTCLMVIRNEVTSRDHQHLNWENMSRLKPFGNNDIREVGDLILIDVTLEKHDLYRRNGVFDELNIRFYFRRGQYKILFLFFLPSILFMIVSWLSLSLGPMAITRSVLIVGSLVLLLTHYYTNMAGLPETTGITSIDLWKVFSLLFVVGILIELVFVTCMASMGRSTKFTQCCRRRKKKDKYELEPLYEELNDLRTRRTRSTCGCCRYSALIMDCLALWTSAAILVLFMFILYTRGPLLVKWLNDINSNDLSLA